MRDYQTFLDSKKNRIAYHGIEIPDSAVNPILYLFQRDITRWACHKGRAAIFLDTGLGKTFIQLEWARLMGERSLVIAPRCYVGVWLSMLISIGGK